ncbi:MAG: type IV pilus assembly protein PilM, partial [Desulfobacteraceae bacterium]
MFFGKKDHLVGLDIGSRSIKVAELAETKKGPSLKKFGLIDLAPGAIEEGLVRDPKAVADSIRELFKLYNVSEQNVAISIGGYSVIVKKIFVPSMTEEKLQETIHLEAEQYIPFDISDVNLDFQIIGESEHNANQMAVLLVAAKKEMINDYVQLVQMAGLNPCTIDIDAFALQNIFEINHQDNPESVALIDIGASKTSLNILKGKTSVFMRDVSLGCAQINQKMVSLLGCSFEEAEQIKLSEQPEGISPENLREITSAIVSDWCTEIRRALDFFYS